MWIHPDVTFSFSLACLRTPYFICAARIGTEGLEYGTKEHRLNNF